MKTVAEVFSKKFVDYLIEEYGIPHDAKAVSVAPCQYSIFYSEPVAPNVAIRYREFKQVHANNIEFQSYWIAYAFEIDTLFWWQQG